MNVHPSPSLVCWIAPLVASLLACDAHDTRGAERFARARRNAAPAAREWRSYLGDPGVTHHSPLDQIHTGNVRRLAPAWSYESGPVEANGRSEIQCNPLVVKGVLYGTSPTLRLFALEAATGEELWSFDPSGGGGRGSINPNRGVAYFEGDGREGEERILYTAGENLYAVDARTGRAIHSFGDRGRVSLRDGLSEDSARDFVVATTPGAIYRDLLILGSRVSELGNAAPGHVRAYDVHTGDIRWMFRTIPRPGEVGHGSWPPDAWKHHGGANAWAGISVDVGRGLAFIPTGSPAYDFYGGDRRGDNLFGNSLLAVDAATGERRWHFQVVRHDLWDRDLPAPPTLVTLRRGGLAVPAVAQPTKTGHVFVFHRETGEPLHPIEEVEVRGEALPGEAPARSQPLPVQPPPVVRQRFTEAEITALDPAARAHVLERVKGMRFGDLWGLPSREGTVLMPGLDGGAEWGGAAFDPETGLLYLNANEAPSLVQMVPAPDASSARGVSEAGYLLACAACHGIDGRGSVLVPSLLDLGKRMGPLDAYRVVRDGRGRMSGSPLLRWYEIAGILWYVYTGVDGAQSEPAAAEPALTEPGSMFGSWLNAGWENLRTPDGLPGINPPWGTLSAIDLARGEIAWQVPFGDYPQALERGLSGLGAASYGGPVVTAGGLLFIAATPDEMLRAFDKRSGALLWQVKLPFAGFATPAIYEARGRQFVVIAAGGGKLGRPSGGRYVAFALPQTSPARGAAP